ncbi:MAG: DUF4198 domain-containing protein [Acidobacteria bacterium]|nr:DUF4198 domain-containing protein [Acidobacteriota bacterium]
MKRLMLVPIVLTLARASLSAHDVWIEPTTFAPRTGEIVGVRLRVGQDFLGDPLPRDPSLINEFIVEDPEGRKPVVGRPGADPAGLVRAAAPGLLVVGYRSNPSRIEQSHEKFTQYLKEEGLESIIALGARRGDARPVRELFARCAKSLISSGETDGSAGDRPLGFTLELVAERNPFAMNAGQELPVRLTYENRPLAGALVVAINRANPSEKLSARSDRDGRVRFRLPRAGAWLVKAVHMVEAPAASGADWASYWASLTFELP